MLADGFLSNLFFEGSAVTYEYLPFTFYCKYRYESFFSRLRRQLETFYYLCPTFLHIIRFYETKY